MHIFDQIELGHVDWYSERAAHFGEAMSGAQGGREDIVAEIKEMMKTEYGILR